MLARFLDAVGTICYLLGMPLWALIVRFRPVRRILRGKWAKFHFRFFLSSSDRRCDNSFATFRVWLRCAGATEVQRILDFASEDLKESSPGNNPISVTALVVETEGFTFEAPKTKLPDWW